MATIKQIQKKYKESLPQVYKKFFRLCYWKIPASLIGTDLLNSHEHLKTWAEELLEENGLDNFLRETDCVFMMHQGYQFWYFAVDGQENPDVYHFLEGEMKPKRKMDLNSFLEELKN